MRRCHPGPPFLLTSAERDQRQEPETGRAPSHGQVEEDRQTGRPNLKKIETMATSCLAIPLMEETGEDFGLEVGFHSSGDEMGSVFQMKGNGGESPLMSYLSSIFTALVIYSQGAERNA
ncbi:hypothetical protein FQN60_015676 [Etheostoma spectabile]|uniref:Uncharacterized protein n=1 Tax=Etheostoma spectabile TaxID=54343 RepID=A0A5J5CRQ1_9PERO|nr:hypothetical protein FQN60_015676 [Etheostoma spectabile]